MASYLELFDARDNDEFRRKIRVAIWITAEDIYDEAVPSAKKLAWAEDALENENKWASRLVRYLLAGRKGQDQANVLAMSDTQIKNKVKNAVDKITAA